MHITSYLYGETPEALFRFTEAACRSGCFREVFPVRRGDGAVIAVAFLTGDGGAEMETAVRALSGILGRDIEITAARDSAAGAAAARRRTWFVPGRSSEVRQGQVIVATAELTPGPTGT